MVLNKEKSRNFEKKDANVISQATRRLFDILFLYAILVLQQFTALVPLMQGKV